MNMDETKLKLIANMSFISSCDVMPDKVAQWLKTTWQSKLESNALCSLRVSSWFEAVVRDAWSTASDLKMIIAP
jgi:hypothetical protein